MAEASRSTVVALICNAVTFSFQRCAQMYFTIAPRPTIKSFTPQAKPGAVWSNERKCSITVIFDNSSATRSKCGKTAAFSSTSQ